eukprot:Skav207902  [mRNA]  locus=scaffold190:23205:29973:+ [translate_table: standard]
MSPALSSAAQQSGRHKHSHSGSAVRPHEDIHCDRPWAIRHHAFRRHVAHSDVFAHQLPPGHRRDQGRLSLSMLSLLLLLSMLCLKSSQHRHGLSKGQETDLEAPKRELYLEKLQSLLQRLDQQRRSKLLRGLNEAQRLDLERWMLELGAQQPAQ